MEDKKRRVNMPLSEDAIENLKRIAKEDHRTMSGEMEFLIAERAKKTEVK